MAENKQANRMEEIDVQRHLMGKIEMKKSVMEIDCRDVREERAKQMFICRVQIVL